METSRANIEQAYQPHSGLEWHFPCSMRSKWRHRAGKSALQSIRMPLALLNDLHEERRRGRQKINEEKDTEGTTQRHLYSLRGLGRSVFRRNMMKVYKSSRRKTKDSWSFPPISFVSRPLTPPYVPFGIRRFLTLCAIERSSPLGKGSQHGEVYRSPQHGALCLPHWPNILCYCSHRFAPSMA